MTWRIGKSLGQVPIKQVDVTDLPGGDVYEVEAADGTKSFTIQKSKEVVGGKQSWRMWPTLPVFSSIAHNGIHCRGVLGAVRCFTDATVRKHNLKVRYPAPVSVRGTCERGSRAGARPA
jgi:hypothetical protein